MANVGKSARGDLIWLSSGGAAGLSTLWIGNPTALGLVNARNRTLPKDEQVMLRTHPSRGHNDNDWQASPALTRQG